MVGLSFQGPDFLWRKNGNFGKNFDKISIDNFLFYNRKECGKSKILH